MRSSIEEPVIPLQERRRDADRRSRPTSPWGSLRGWQRRRLGRRREDRDSYVDAFTRGDVLLLVSIFTLNLLDAGCTLVYLSRGGLEANPAMAHLLEVSDWAFLAQKCFVVGAWLVFLTIHKNFRFARFGLRVLLSLYAGVFAYHVLLLAVLTE